METKEGLSQKGSQRRTLIRAGIASALSAVLTAIGCKSSETEVKKEEFYKQAEAARRAKEAAEKAKEVEQAKKLAVTEAKEKPTLELSTDRVRRQAEELKEKLAGNFDVTVEFDPRPQIISPQIGIYIHTFPGISEETRVGAFSENDKTPELLAIISVYDEGNSTRYEWGVFRYEEVKERNIYFKDKKPTVATKDWGEVVFACLKKGDEVYMAPTSSKQ